MTGFKLFRKIQQLASDISRTVAGVTRPVEMMDMTQSAGLVKVTLWFIDHLGPARFSPTEHIVAASDVDQLVKASLDLHSETGRAAPVQYITTQVLRPRGPFWWSVPGLGRNGDPAGAVIWDWAAVEYAWVHPNVVIDED